MITIAQVHENNVVAKQWIAELIAEIKKMRESTEARNALPFSQRIALEVKHAKLYSSELYLQRELETCLMFLKIYFKYHYKHAGLSSKLISPELKFSTTNDYIIMSIKKTFTVAEAPHGVKDV